jgi:hypothetical protein
MGTGRGRFMSAWPIQQKIKGTPNAGETFVIYRAQSLLTKKGKIGPLIPYHAALEVIRRHEDEQRKVKNG